MQDSKCWYQSVCSNVEEECEKNCIRYQEMNFLMSSSGIPKARQTPSVLMPAVKDYDAFCRLKEIKDNITEFVDNGNNLYICSNNTGNGKTSWAIKLMLKYFNDIWAGNGFRVRGLFINVPTLLIRLKDFNNPLPKEYRDNILNADLIIWDDIASTEVSQYDYNQLISFIDHRILECKANIFTSNSATKAEFEKMLGAKLASRIYNSSEIVEFKGGDRR